MLGWLALTILLGGIFLGGQANEYWKLFQSGVDLSTNMFSTTFFTLTGFHGLHVLIGLIALLIFLWAAWEVDFVSSKFDSAGPARTFPSGLKREPWQGQSQVCSA